MRVVALGEDPDAQLVRDACDEIGAVAACVAAHVDRDVGGSAEDRQAMLLTYSAPRETRTMASLLIGSTFIRTSVASRRAAPVEVSRCRRLSSSMRCLTTCK